MTMCRAFELVAPAALLLALFAGACPTGDIRVPGGKDMGEECFDDDECDEPGTCLNGVCSGYPCGEEDACDNDLTCERVSDRRSCVVLCEDASDCVGRQDCVEVARSASNDTDKVQICL